MTLIYIIIASLAESFVALTGIFFVFLSYNKLKKYLPYFISFSIGTFLGVIFLNILPEAIEKSSVDVAFSFTLAGFLFFFLLSRFLHWYHHHHENGNGSKEIEHHIGDEAHPKITSNKATGYLVLAGDAVHNFIDGVIITFAFLADFNIGLVTTIAVLMHEFPQEAADFFVLLNSGFSKMRALLLNFTVAFTTLIGALLTYFFVANFDKVVGPALGIVAGNFLYISASDLVPELAHMGGARGLNTIIQFLLILFGILVIYAIITIIPE
jgi:zinc and cadmium transporter